MHIEPPPTIADTIQIRNIQLPLPVAPEAWHRSGQQQPCTASFRLRYASSVASAEGDDVSLTIDYGKLFRRIKAEVGDLQSDNVSAHALAHGICSIEGKMLGECLFGEVGQDIRLTAGIIARCGLKQLEDTAAACSGSAHPAIRGDYGEFEVQLQLPKAILRTDGGLKYHCKSALAATKDHPADELETNGNKLVVLEEKFEISDIRCSCIIGINPWERAEKQAVHISLTFDGPGLQEWGSTVVKTYQEMTREVAERVEGTSFGSIEALGSLVARIATVDFGNESVTVLIEKPNAIAFVEGSGLEITRSRAFFE